MLYSLHLGLSWMRDMISGRPQNLSQQPVKPKTVGEAILDQLAPTNIPADLRYMSELSQDQPSLAKISRTSQLTLDVGTNNKLLLVVWDFVFLFFVFFILSFNKSCI